MRGTVHTFALSSEFFGGSSRGISCTPPDMFSCSWGDEVGRSMVEGFKSDYEKVAQGCLDAFDCLCKADDGFPRIYANEKYEHRTFEILMLKAE